MFTNYHSSGQIWTLPEAGIQDEKLFSLWSCLLLLARLCPSGLSLADSDQERGTHQLLYRFCGTLAAKLGRALGGEVLVEDINSKALG